MPSLTDPVVVAANCSPIACLAIPYRHYTFQSTPPVAALVALTLSGFGAAPCLLLQQTSAAASQTEAVMSVIAHAVNGESMRVSRTSGGSCLAERAIAVFSERAFLMGSAGAGGDCVLADIVATTVEALTAEMLASQI